MPMFKLVTEVVPKKTQILITYPNTPIGLEIIRQLQKYSHLEILPVSDPFAPLPDVSNLGVIIHPVGFATTSLSATLSYTSGLHKLLSLAQSHQSQFILVLSNTHNHLYHTALTLVNQYVRSFPLTYQVLEVDQTSSPSQMASEIIKKFIRHHQGSVLLRPNSPAPPPPHRSSKKLITVLLSLLLIPWAVYLLLLGLLALSFNCTTYSLQSLNYPRASTCASLSLQLTRIISLDQPFALGASPLFTRLGLPPSQLVTLVDGLSHTTLLLEGANRASADFLFRVLHSTAPAPDSRAQDQSMSLLSESLSSYQSDLKSLYLGNFRLPGVLTSLAQTAARLHDSVNQSQQVAASLPQFLPTGRLLNYLLVVQDNTRLTPTGGFLDSLVYFTLDDGRLTRAEVFTSQSADTQLISPVAPPPDFQFITGNSAWYLRDSNWDPDFPTSARKIAGFVDKELSKPVDVVIAANLTTLSRLLSVIGPQAIPDLHLTVTADTLVPQYLAYLADHPQADKFIYQVLSQSLDQLKLLDAGQLQLLTPKILQALQTKDLLVYPVSFTSPTLSTVGWSGGVGLPPCRTTSVCVNDYVYVSNTNLSRNHSDVYLQPKFNMTTEIAPLQIHSVFDLVYTLPDSAAARSAGAYKNYLRLYLSPGYLISAVRLNSQVLPPTAYSVSDAHGVKLLALPFDLTPGSTVSLQIDATQSLPAAPFHYQLTFPHQPGQSVYPAAFAISYPKDWFATASDATVASPGLLRYNTAPAYPVSFDIDLSAPQNSNY